ncbi:MAG: HesA/MoeB/ThiF family protein, partial [Sulfolobus sp.]|nr:HesA/MoeB/ThiF family protein [Sulfolobus sp.]
IRAAIVGCGALGTGIAELLARLGVGYLKLIDADYVELSNLNRTHLFEENDLYKPKAISCAEKIKKINSEVKVEPIIDVVTSDNVIKLLEDVDYVFDATDNILTRLIINDACVKLRKPFIYGGVSGLYGSVKLVLPYKTSCLACFMSYSDNDVNACEVIGVVDTITSLVSTLEVQEMLNHLNGSEDGSLIYVDLKEMRFEKIDIEKNPNCEACGREDFVYLKGTYKNECMHMVVSEPLNEHPVISNEWLKIYKTSSGVIVCYNNGKCFKRVVR